jgi:hypothetical protein
MKAEPATISRLLDVEEPPVVPLVTFVDLVSNLP